MKAGKQARETRNNEYKKRIVELVPSDSNDFETLTLLYRQIFEYLIEFYEPCDGSSVGKAAEREVAAALESVFPRVGLKSFVELLPHEKSVQLEELARIVLGIRLFNKELGKGGSGIDDMDLEVEGAVRGMREELVLREEEVSMLCADFQKALLNKHRMGEEEGVTRWTQELANRRQFLTFLQALLEDVDVAFSTSNQLKEALKSELFNLQSVVGSKSSVAKEDVYPRFDAIAKLWLDLLEIRNEVWEKKRVLDVLNSFLCSYSSTLSRQDVPLTDPLPLPKEHFMEEEYQDKDDSKLYEKEVSEGKEYYDEKEEEDNEEMRSEEKKEEEKETPDEKLSKMADEKGGSSKEDEEDLKMKKEVVVVSEEVQLLSIETTPQLLNVPLQLQGFCPSTFLSKNGLLLPGAPSLGFIQFENSYYVCATEDALKDFMANARGIVRGIKEKVGERPEYIHLLGMQAQFPNSSITKLLNRPELQENDQSIPSTKDVGTETPVHFVERNMDVNYHWNEWELRRRALKVVNLRNCSTSETQTDQSHFKREIETQVYLPRDESTQTRGESGNNPPKVIGFLAGLRGESEGKESVSQYATSTGLRKRDQKPSLVQLTLDL